jgi:hypothetical protein
MKRLLFALLAFGISCWATLPQTVRWNVERTTGASDANGGGFDTAKAGTDYSQSVNNGGSCAAKLNIDGSAVTATASGVTVTFTGGTHTATAAEVGNLFYLAAGSGATLGWYEITAYSSTTWTLERTTGMSGGAVTGYMGGCLLTPQQAMTNMGNTATSPSAIDQIAYIKAGTSAYPLAAALTMPSMAAASSYNTRFVGYATSQGDRGLLTVSAATNAAAAVFAVTGHLLGTSGTITLCDVKGGTGNWAAVNGVQTIALLDANTFSVPVDSTGFGAMTGAITVSVRPLFSTNAAPINGLNMSTAVGWKFENFILDGTGTTGTHYGVYTTANYTQFYNVRVRNFPAECWYNDTYSYTTFYAIEASGCGGTTAQVLTGNYVTIAYSYIHNGSKSGISMIGTGNTFIGNVAANNTGAASDGLILINTSNLVLGNLLYGNGRDGIRFAGSNIYPVAMASLILGNRFENNGQSSGAGYGANLPNRYYSGTLPAVPYFDYNSYWNNKSGALAYLTQGTHDVTATTDPSVAANNGTIAAAPNFSLNSSATGGALLRSTGLPGLLPGLGNSIGYTDIGPLRHADPASSSVGSGSYSWVK